jgi:hypothetical protein
MQLDYYYSLKGDPEKHKRFIENRKKYNKKIKQKRLEYYKDYRKKYPERISSYSLKYYYKNRDKCLKDNKEWRNKNIIPKWKEEFININKFKRINKESLKTRQVKTKYDKPFCIRRTPKDLVSII